MKTEYCLISIVITYFKKSQDPYNLKKKKKKKKKKGKNYR